MKWRAKDSIESENSLAAASFLSFSLSHLNTLTHILSPVHTLLLLFLATKAKYNSLLLSEYLSLACACVRYALSLSLLMCFSLSLSLSRLQPNDHENDAWSEELIRMFCAFSIQTKKNFSKTFLFYFLRKRLFLAIFEIEKINKNWIWTVRWNLFKNKSFC